MKVNAVQMVAKLLYLKLVLFPIFHREHCLCFCGDMALSFIFSKFYLFCYTYSRIQAGHWKSAQDDPRVVKIGKLKHTTIYLNVSWYLFEMS